jgi:hypothetical protein
MASYTELRNLFNDDVLVNKVTVATVIAANNLLSGTPSAADKAYAAQVFASPRSEAEKVLMSVLAANAAVTVGNIQSATDSAIQSKVDDVVPHLVDALAGV